MPNRLAIIAASLVLAFAVAGCSSGEQSASQPGSASTSSEAVAEAPDGASAEAASSEPSLFTAGEWPECEATEDVPVPSFSVSPSNVNEGNMVFVSYEGVPEGEVAAYVDQVKDAGFTYSAIENKGSTSYYYSARNGEDASGNTSLMVSYTSDGTLEISSYKM